MTMTMIFWQWFIGLMPFDAFFFQVIRVDDTNVFFTFSVTGLK